MGRAGEGEVVRNGGLHGTGGEEPKREEGNGGKERNGKKGTERKEENE
jgi:hypothetical protein